jgi:hypothetical protein
MGASGVACEARAGVSQRSAAMTLKRKGLTVLERKRWDGQSILDTYPRFVRCLEHTYTVGRTDRIRPIEDGEKDGPVGDLSDCGQYKVWRSAQIELLDR